MGTLTKYNALVGELEPYTPSRLALQKALADVKISDWDSEYNADTDQRTIAIAAIKVLKRMIVLTNDTLGKSSQGYSVEKLEKRIKDLCNENGLDVSDFVEVSSITEPSYFEGDLSIGARVEVTLERGGVDEFTISGIDDTNPKYIEIWG